MIDPFTAWSRLFAAGLEMQATWLRGIETPQASHSVIDARTGEMRHAMDAPLQADIAEFARMVPEKIDAFSRSANAVTRETMAMYGTWVAQMQRDGMMMLAGRLPTMAEASALATQTANYTLGAITAGARLGTGALAPVHRLERARSR